MLFFSPSNIDLLDKICRVELNYSEEICANLTNDGFEVVIQAQFAILVLNISNNIANWA